MPREPKPAVDIPSLPLVNRLPVASLARRKSTQVDLRPTREETAALADWVGATRLDDLRLKGEIVPRGAEGWALSARLTARAEQPCVISLRPVEQAIDEPVQRQFQPEDPGADLVLDIDPDADADDAPEPLGDVIDLGLILTESLALALEPYPRHPDAVLDDASAAPPGAAAIEAETVRPFSKLAALKAKLEGDGN